MKGRCTKVEGLVIKVDEMLGSTGLAMKVDPGVPVVYAGFAGSLLAHAHMAGWSAARFPSMLHVKRGSMYSPWSRVVHSTPL